MCGRLLFYYSIKVNKEVLGMLEEDVCKHGGCFFYSKGVVYTHPCMCVCMCVGS